MSTTGLAGLPPRSMARAAGAFWLANAVLGTLMAAWPGVLVTLGAGATYLGAALFVYLLLKPVNRNLSLLAALSGCVGVSIGMVGNIGRLGLMGYEFLFYGLHVTLVGHLILQSAFLPRALGLIVGTAGLSWLAFSTSSLLLPPETSSTFAPYTMAAGILGELLLTFWLLIAGVDERQWHEQSVQGSA